MSCPSVQWVRLSVSLLLTSLFFGLPSVPSRGQPWFGVSATLAGQASFPDLVVSSISNPPTSAVAGAVSLSITDTTGNIGDGTANPSTTRYRLSVDNVITSADTLLTVTRSIPTLKKNSSSTGTVGWTIPANFTPGTYYLGACADDLSLISESNETNNCRVSTSTIQIYPPTSLSVTPTTVSAGTSVTATWTQINSATSTDWIGLYVPGSANSAYVTYIYVNCSSTPTVAVPAGSCPFSIPFWVTPGTYELRLQWNGGFSTRATSNTFTVTSPPTPSKLAITSVNGGTNATAGTAFPVIVQVQGESGIPTIVSSATNVSLSLKTGTGNLGGTLSGTISANASQVTISGVTYTKAESGVVLTATQTSGVSLAPGDSAPFAVNSGAASSLVFVTQPSNGTAGLSLPGPPTIAVRDSLGNNVTSTTSVTISLGNNFGGASLGGTTTKNTSSGLASFDNLTVNKSANGYTLIASATGLTSATSAPFFVSPTTATTLAFATQPNNATLNTAIPGPPAVVVRDNQGNTVTNSSAPITIGISTNPGSAILSGTTVKNASGGVSVFADLKINQAGNGYTLTATSAGLISATTSSFNVASGGSVAGTVSKAAGGSPISGASVQARQAGVVKGTATTNSGGNYTISGLSVGNYDIRADAGGFSPQTQGALTVSAGSTTTANFSLAVAAATAGIVYIYDDLQRLKSVIDPVGEAASYAYDAVGNLLSITRNNSSQTSIIDFNPNSGPVGSTVTIHGTGYSATPSQNSVTFNGVAAPVISSTLTQIVTTVPAGATTGPVTVTSPAGPATSSAAFTVTGAAAGAPTIANFIPTIGVPGTAITVTGTNFDTTPSNNEVRFNPTLAVVTSSSSTSIDTNFPVAGQPGKISLSTADGTALSSQDFFVVPAPYSVADVETTSRLVAGGSNQTVTISAANKIGLLIFDAVAGQTLNLGITANTFPGSGTNANLYIYKPDRTLLSSRALNQSNTAIDFYVPAKGTYTIVVDPVGTSPGSVTLTLSVDLNAGSISINGPSNTATISRPGQRAFVTFNGTAGQNISIASTNQTFGWGGFCCSILMTIYKPDGSQLASTGVNQSPGAFDYLLPSTGTYTILINPAEALTGSVTLTLSEDFNAGSVSINGASITATVSRPGQRVFVTFSGAVGQSISVAATANTFGWGGFCCSTLLTIYKPDGSALPSQGVTQNNGAFDRKLPDAGIYKLLINPAEVLTGSMTLTLSEDANFGSISNGGSVPVTISRLGQRARLTFSGNEGDQVGIRASNSTIPCCSNILFLNPDETTLTSKGGISTAGGVLYTSPLAASATYTILINPDAVQTGDMTISFAVSNASVSASPTTVSAGNSVTATWANIPFPSSNDWLALYVPGTGDNSYLASRFTDGAASGSLPLTIPSNLAPGTYELRLLPYQGYPHLAISNTFTVTNP